jgi:NADPH:quinone reductase-like Zn-dependent oxidoreductase
MRSGDWPGKDTPPLPITPGVDFVGKIFCIDKDISSLLHLSVGDSVISLTRCGGNSRFISIDPVQLVKISPSVDPAEAACLGETYLSAFQVLHFGQTGGTRYRSTALKGKSILILGAVATTLGHAIFELATAGGVGRIFATATPKHFPHLRSLGIIPISADPALWYDQLNGEIDLVLVSDTNEEVVPAHFRVLKESGHLIVIGQLVGSGSPVGDWETKGQTRAKQLVCKRNKTKVSMIDRTHDYNPFRQWAADLQKSKKDLAHLVKLLEKGTIKPNVLDRIPLNKVAKAQEMVESKRHASGFLVCEPWLRNKKRAVRL